VFPKSCPAVACMALLVARPPPHTTPPANAFRRFGVSFAKLRYTAATRTGRLGDPLVFGRALDRCDGGMPSPTISCRAARRMLREPAFRRRREKGYPISAPSPRPVNDSGLGQTGGSSSRCQSFGTEMPGVRGTAASAAQSYKGHTRSSRAGVGKEIARCFFSSALRLDVGYL
jgi:hypothetical protein